MKKRGVLYYGFSLFSGIAAFFWVKEMIQGTFDTKESGPFGLAVFCCFFFLFLAVRISTQKTKRQEKSKTTP